MATQSNTTSGSVKRPGETGGDPSPPNDELMHPELSDNAWSESYYFNFVDPNSGLGMFTRMGFRPGSGWVDALHVVYLGGKRVAFTYGRRAIESPLSQYDGDLSAGDLALTCMQPFKQWRLQFDGAAQDIADSAILLERRKLRPADWFCPATLSMDLTFDCTTEPHYAARGEHGHFEQAGQVTGTVAMGAEQWQVSGYGVRDKSWGPRDWGAGQRKGDNSEKATPQHQEPAGPAPFVNWFSMNFGADIALGGSCFRAQDGKLRGAGWYQADGQTMALNDVEIVSKYASDSILHTDVQLTATTEAGTPLVIAGKVLNVCPTKIAMPGGATFVNEGLTQFEMDGRTGYGIAEHWHAVST